MESDGWLIIRRIIHRSIVSSLYPLDMYMLSIQFHTNHSGQTYELLGGGS